jgi:FAD dependent oxidoreductase TIGR03364
MSGSFDVAVVGAGIVGLGAAYAASRRGQRVVVIERGPEALGATVRNFGHLCIGAQTGLARRYADVSRPLWLRLSKDAGFWVRESGTLVVARAADELALLEAAAAQGGIDLLSTAQLESRASVRPGISLGGALIRPDLQTNPRTAAHAIRAHLEARGVEFRTRTSVLAVRAGRVETTRGAVDAGDVVVAVNHDIDQLLPELAESAGIVRCGLDMLRVRGDGISLPSPLLTGWSLVRYGRFASLPEAGPVRERLHAERPDLAELDLNQMYTQLPDGSIIVGDTHYRGVGIPPFQAEAAADLLLTEYAALWGTRPRVIERWQGVYASAPDDFLIAEPEPGVLALAATTGIGMTTGLGLAEAALAPRLGVESDALTPEGITS